MRSSSDSSATYLVTGAAGFIGSYVCRRLLGEGCTVVGVDNLNDYYSVDLKRARLDALTVHERFTFIRADVANRLAVNDIFELHQPEIVVHLAAQAGVRYSLENPDAYIQSNIVGFFNVLEACRIYNVSHLIYASSSSVYGSNTKVPFEETDPVNQPVSLYAATKCADEILAHTYSHVHGLRATGLRFFTVYGPMGRPDMAYFTFADMYFSGQPIEIYNDGDLDHDLYRDFTYIDDIVEGISRVLQNPPECMPPHKVFNIGNSKPVKLMQFIEELEGSFTEALGRRVVFSKDFQPHKLGDVRATYASTALLEEAVGFRPSTPLSEGLRRFARWYVNYYGRQ